MFECKSLFNAWKEIQGKYKIPVKPKFSFDENPEAQIGFFYKKDEISNDIVTNAINSVGMIKTPNTIATCFVIKKDNDSYFLASALHCFCKPFGENRYNDPAKYHIHFENGKELIIRSDDVKKAYQYDKADKIIFPIPKIDGVEGIYISNNKLEDGEIVFAIGHPDIRERCRNLNESLISVGEVHTPPEIYIRVEPGNSGGPVLNTKGEVVGIITQGQFGIIKSDRQMRSVYRPIDRPHGLVTVSLF
jgi:CBS domain-containing protein